MSYALSTRSKNNLAGVHPDLVKVVEKAIQIATQDFVVIEGLRTVERQKILVAEGKSKTMNSRHIVGVDGYGHAVDIVPLVNGTVSWAVKDFKPLADAMKKAATELGVSIEHGGDWTSFKDYPHWQLPYGKYK